METFKSLNSFFEEELEELNIDEHTKSYIIGVFIKYRNSYYDLGGKSIAIEYLTAQQKRDFERFQNIGDWIFFISSIYPQHLKNAPQEYYYDVARLSYIECYRIVRSWVIFEIMADRFVELNNRIRNQLFKI